MSWSVTNVKKSHNIMCPFVTNLRKCHKSMGLVSNLLIHDENIVSVTDRCNPWRFAKHHKENVIDQQVLFSFLYALMSNLWFLYTGGVSWPCRNHRSGHVIVLEYFSWRQAVQFLSIFIEPWKCLNASCGDGAKHKGRTIRYCELYW
jgi:hypothetical protein